ncbi:glutamine ABC transporter, ATP-binding protein GlnQ [Liquorilactobacillus sucicola DSM 21376 = JCM 15457]|uniref:Glutamine ABC transporter, ATP-binding protein GlnQ n=1 Tax=Liquorilactobacillus sucicola DSM 21376 = JCM 15457 TaxID=1423806 RepID=A0A0R2DWF8_9LACO|nr:glutamine ABC transporter, ATP-binding protein GlnQ [Liquorilactobacillus sucicola DSM 21376 = JCM 15457]
MKDLSVNIGKKKILKHINLNIEEGTVTALVGPSGSGKTTLLRTLNLLQIPTAGSLKVGTTTAIAGKIDTKTIHDLRQNSAMVFQQFNLFKNLTALENVANPLIYTNLANKKEAHKTALKILKKIGLEEVITQYPATLSGGQQQRVSIARAVAVRPRVILFDEPTSALDPELVESVLQTIAGLAKENITMILVTHEMDFARQIADEAVFIENGEVLSKGPAKELLSGRTSPRIDSFINSLKRSAFA